MRHSLMRCVGGIGLALLFALSPSAADQAKVYKVEEDWELKIQHPDPAICSPQVTFFTSPSVNTSNDYFQLQMNYHCDEWFDEGGFHVAAVHDGQTVDEARSATNAPMTLSCDDVRWTSVMAAIDGQLLFAVKNGYSHQWGHFGGPEYLVRIDCEDHSDLSSYHHSQSLDSVDIGFGGNRVTSITLKTVRLYYTDGKMTTIDVNANP